MEVRGAPRLAVLRFRSLRPWPILLLAFGLMFIAIAWRILAPRPVPEPLRVLVTTPLRRSCSAHASRLSSRGSTSVSGTTCRRR